MFGKRHSTEVAIVGAGPVGMTAGLLLNALGSSVELFDKDRGPSLHSYSPALHPSSLEILNEVGLADVVLKNAKRIRRIEFFEGCEQRAEVDLGKLDSPYPYLAVVGQQGLEALLEEALMSRHCKIHWHHRLRDFDAGPGRVDSVIDQIELGMTGYAYARMEMMVDKVHHWASDYLIGADGYDSVVRNRLNLSFQSRGEREQYAVFEFKSDTGLDDDAMRVVFDSDGLGVLWPLADGFWRWSFAVGEIELFADARDKDMKLVQVGDGGYPELGEDLFGSLLEKRAPWFEGSISEIRWRIAVSFENCVVPAYGKDHIWMVGDAAHLTGPVGLQSMNIGMREARDLTRIIASPGNVDRPAALEAFSKAQVSEWQAILDPDRPREFNGAASDWVRENSSTLLRCLPVSGEHYGPAAAQLGIKVV